nr:hypothetical protein [Kofleriaceae bacterium]
MADDAGALLVRSGLVSSSSLDVARTRVTELGGTLGEHLVVARAVDDDALTEFYRQRLLVPQVNPNTLARLPAKVVAAIPADMAIELRAVPVSLDQENNLTVAMSDPSDRHAVDEIAFFTGAYVVRAVATQMQIAWCLAHYYGHVTPLGQRLMTTGDPPAAGAVGAPATNGDALAAGNAAHVGGPASSGQMPRPRGHTAKVDATRHRAAPPITGAHQIARPSSKPLDDPRPAPRVPTPPSGIPASELAAPRARRETPPADDDDQRTARPAVDNDREDTPTARPAARVRAHSEPVVPAGDGIVEQPRARSVSGEIRLPKPRAQSIKPDVPPEDEISAPVITIEVDSSAHDEEPPPPVRKPAPRRRIVEPDPPELAARAGEVSTATGPVRTVDLEEPRIVIADDAYTLPAVNTEPEPEPEPEPDAQAIPQPRTQTGDITRELEPAPPFESHPTIEVSSDAGDPDSAVIHGHVERDIEREPSAPILLERKRAQGSQSELDPAAGAPLAGAPAEPDHGDGGEVVVLDARKPRAPRPEKRTVIGMAVSAPAATSAAPAKARAPRDTVTDSSVPGEIDDLPTGVTRAAPPANRRDARDDDDDDDDEPGDATRVDTRAAPPRDKAEATDETLAAPPPPAGTATQSMPAEPPPPAPAPAPGDDDDDDDDQEDTPVPPRAKKKIIASPTTVMSTAELDAAVPERRTSTDVLDAQRRTVVDYDPLDDGWGPPGTTIPPPLLGAIPGGDDAGDGATIPIANVDSAPLMVAAPSPPESARETPAVEPSGQSLVRALEHATSSAIELIRALEHAESRDDVVELMVAHLAATHHRAGFFVVKTGLVKVGELAGFAIEPPVAIMSSATLRLDRASTLADVVGTRLPYRGPMHDDASRTFLTSVLGACPPEILLVPVAIRERVVGVLFGEHRRRHTFDDQLALAGRAAGLALERILKTRRS